MRRVARALHILRALFTADYAHVLEYRAELLFWALSGTLPLILMGIWMQTASAGNLGLIRNPDFKVAVFSPSCLP